MPLSVMCRVAQSFPAVEGGFDVVEQDGGPADHESSGPVEDARVVAGGEVGPEPQLAGIAVGGVDEIPSQRVVDLAQVSGSFR